MLKTLLLIFITTVSFSSFAQKVEIFVEITPAGSFTATSKKINGRVVLKDKKVEAKRITVPIDTFSTEVGLRDEHFKKYLKQSEYPRAILTDLTGENGIAKANLEVSGIKKDITIAYKIKEEIVFAEFTLNVQDFNLPKAKYLEVGVSEKVFIKVELPLNNIKNSL